jgi:alpha-beta hydrolase superfamily lysophospholipase
MQIYFKGVPMLRTRPGLILSAAIMLLCAAITAAETASQETKACVADLSSLHLSRLAERLSSRAAPAYAPITRLAASGERNPYTASYYRRGTSPGPVFLLAFEASGLRQYARLDLPAHSNADTPLLVYAHGYVGHPASLSFNLAYDLDSMSGEFIARWVEAGFAVLSPGYRGHGTFAGTPADGAEYLELWDKGGTYLTPTFYAMDILAAIDALPSLASLDLGVPMPDTRAVALLGHSQGGDAALTALALDSFMARPGPRIAAASLWAGCVGDRLAQLELYAAMTTLSGFVAGDGVWRKSALGTDGSINADFRWPWPQDWTAMEEDPENGYQPAPSAFATESVSALAHEARDRLLETVRSCSPESGLDDAIGAIRAASGHAFAQRIRQPLHLHSSDQDFYSPPTWNEELARRININKGRARVFVHPATNHALRVSDQAWFSPPGTEDGLAAAVSRDAELFREALLRSATHRR